MAKPRKSESARQVDSRRHLEGAGFFKHGLELSLALKRHHSPKAAVVGPTYVLAAHEDRGHAGAAHQARHLALHLGAVGDLV
eukprot:scaffold134_cov244-Pinguiococcus_pyrenoidosus.AAC.8